MPRRLEDLGQPLRQGADALTAVGGSFRYAEQLPTPSQHAAIACTWASEVTGDGAHSQRVLPDGCVEIVFSAEHPALVYGPQRRWRDILLAPGARYWGIRLRPGAAGRLLRLDASELADRIQALDAVIDCSAEEPRAQRDAIAARLAAAAARTHPDPAVEHALALLRNRPASPVASVARAVGISARQLQRRFTAAVGISPGAFRRVARADATIRAAAGTPGESWARLAYEFGYSDQAHLSREVSELMGQAPSSIRFG